MSSSNPQTFAIVTLGCPKNQVDSDKLSGKLTADGLVEAVDPEHADLVVVNTCAFIEEARQESIDTVLELDDHRAEGSRLVVTGCMAERYGDELAEALPEVDRVAGFGKSLLSPVSVSIGSKAKPAGSSLADFDLLNLPRPATPAPWAYVKIAEGCDRACGFCAIPTFRGKQRSRDQAVVTEEIRGLDVREVVLIAQDLVSYGRDQGKGELRLAPLVREAAALVDRVRLLYIYPSGLTDALIDAICETGVPYFDLSLQHVSADLLRRMRRPGKAEQYLERIATIRAREPDAAFRSNFIVGYPGETEDDHDELLRFVEEAQVDWCGFFAYSREQGTYAADLDGQVPRGLVKERLAELRELQDTITAARREQLVGRRVEVLVDRPGVGRTHREAPEIDGIVDIPEDLPVGTFQEVVVTGAVGPDLEAGID